MQSAIDTAKKNAVMGDAPSVLTTDVTFPTDPAGNPNRVKVDVFRTTDRTNAIPTLIGPLLGVNTVDIKATATAEASPANAMQCVKPFMIPDKWKENSDANGKPDGPWNPDTEFNLQDNKGKPLANPDVYVGADDPANFTGFSMDRDVGTELVLRAGTGNNIAPSFYFSWMMPGGTGGSWYRDNIDGCNTTVVTWGDQMTQEPGNMMGPTSQGMRDLIAQDPDAKWDTNCSCVADSKFGGGTRSPRVFPIPLYDPMVYATGKQNGRTADFRVANFIGFFVEYEGGNQVTGRIVKINGLLNGNGPKPGAFFPKVIRLVQ